MSAPAMHAPGQAPSRLIVSASPYLKARESTPHIMWTVVATLVPIVVSAAYWFGISALLEIAAATAGCLVVERVFGKSKSLLDGSAMITGLLLGLCLPAGLPLWMAALGGAMGIGFGKIIFGGLGQNVFNPALFGRAFLQASFPVAITTWPKQGGGFWTLRGDLFAAPFMSPQAIDGITAATPLGAFKFESTGTRLADLVIGNTGGSLGETSAIVILLCAAYLAWKQYLNWRIPAAVIGSVAVASAILHQVTPRCPDPLFMVFSGGLILGATYMATDMVTSPVTNMGRWIFGVGVGLTTVVIRVWGGLPEGVMYAILLMNAFTPFINKATQPRVFGATKRVLA